MDTKLTILAIFAHPDDEIGAGSTLARYSDAGHRIVLVCATRGEAATIFCEECATPENLAEVRTRELACACQHIGIGELRWLDWPDGGIKALPRADAVGQIVRLIREIQPDVLLTHAETGLYPHPDHLAVWDFVRAAFDAAADTDEFPAAGPAWATARLFTRAISQSFFDAAPAFAAYRVQLNGQQLPFIPTPDHQIDVTMQVEPWVDRRMAAWDCHRSQHNPNGAFVGVPEAVRREMAANEQFMLVAARSPLPEDVTNDLLAGLERGQPEPLAPTGGVAALRDALAAHRSYLDLCEYYARHSSEPRFVAMAHTLVESHQEAIYLLARVLRRAGEAVGEFAADRPITTQGSRQTQTPGRARFLLASAEQTLIAYRARSASALAEADLWGELATLTEAQIAIIQAFFK